MPQVTNLQTLKDYCFRKLGSPVVEINVSDDQVDDCINDAIQFFQNYYYASTEKILYPYIVSQDDIDREYLEFPDTIIGIERVYRGQGLTDGMFDIEYQIRLTNFDAFYGKIGGGITYYDITMKNLDMLNQYFSPEKATRYNRFTNRCYIDTDWREYRVGNYLMFEAFRVVDPETFGKMYNDEMFKRYTTALIKKQWGTNMSKFEGVQILGGVTLNASRLIDESRDELEKLEVEIKENYQYPLDWFIG